MVIRWYVNCVTCETPHTLRISVGHESYQEHSFSCGECHEDIIVGMEIDFKTPATHLKCIENCEQSEQEGLVINLHPEFPIFNDEKHQDGIFTGMPHVRRIFDSLLENGTANEMPAQFNIASGKQESEDWKIVKKAWSLNLKGRYELAEPYLQKYNHFTLEVDPTMNEVLFNFSTRMLSFGKESIFGNAADFIKKIYEQYPAEFTRFRVEYLNMFHASNMQRYYDLTSDYFKDFSEFNQTLKYSQIGEALPKGSIASSTAFRKTKMFYGNLFEALTSNFVVLACLSNISKGRPYDQFETMNLKKYLSIHKAQRSNPFKDIPAFHVFSDCIITELRNASHHGSMRISSKTGEVSYRSGGTGAEKKIGYGDYLFTCNELFLRFHALLMVELLLIGE